MKKGSIWVSVVLYVLISLTILSLVFAVVKPKIDEAQDRAVIEQSLVMLNDIDQAVKTASQASGTVLMRELKISKGDLFIVKNQTGVTGKIIFILNDTNLQYSQPGTQIMNGNIQILTTNNKAMAEKYDILLKLDFPNRGITHEQSTNEWQLSSSPLFYKLFIKNEGNNYIKFYTA